MIIIIFSQLCKCENIMTLWEEEREDEEEKVEDRGLIKFLATSVNKDQTQTLCGTQILIHMTE